MPAHDGPGPEALHRAVQSLVPISERLRAQAVRSVVVHGGDEEVANRRRGRDSGSPDRPVCSRRQKRD